MNTKTKYLRLRGERLSSDSIQFNPRAWTDIFRSTVNYRSREIGGAADGARIIEVAIVNYFITDEVLIGCDGR